MEMTNGDSFWTKHFSADEQGMHIRCSSPQKIFSSVEESNKDLDRLLFAVPLEF